MEEEFANVVAQLKEVNAQTVEDLANRGQYLQRLLRCMQKNGVEVAVFKSTIKLPKLLESIKDLDSTQQRAEKVMSKQAFQQLKMIKNQLLLIVIISMQREAQDFDEGGDAQAFFTYVLKESTQIEPEIRNFLLMPLQSIKELSFKVLENK